MRRRKGLVVLSLFGGIEAGYVALQRAGIKVDKYYSSEIDPYPISVVKANHPDIIHLGSITEWESWDIEQPDIVIGGSACQNLSFAGKQAGLATKCKKDITTVDQYKQLKAEGFEFEGQSHLFWEMMAIRGHYEPTYFFLENVMFGQKWRDIFNDAIGFEADVLNSALVSAQNRKRQYWLARKDRRGHYRKIPISQPEDKGIILRDIIEQPGTGVIKSYGKLQERNEKGMCLDANYWKGADNHGQRTMIVDHDKRACKEVGRHDPESVTYRKLTPVECCRLQTFSDDYFVKSGISNSRIYKALGNSWTVDIIVHIFNHLKGGD